MKLLKTYFNVALSFLIATTINAQNDGVLSFIPKDAQNIYVVNTPSIIKKADIDAIKNLDFMKELLMKSESENNDAQKIMKNPAESGVSFTQPMVFTLSKTENAQYDLVTMMAPLADFDKFNKIMQSLERKVESKAGINVAQGDSNAVAWNNKMVVFSSFKKSKEKKGLAGLTETDSTAAEQSLPKLDPSVLFQKSEINPRVAAVSALMKEQHDIYIYQTTDGTSNSPSAMIAGMLFNLNPDDLDGNVTNGWADFENGRIYGETHQKLNAVIQEKFGALFNKKPTVNWNNYLNLSGDNKPMATFSLSLNPAGIQQMINESPMMKQGLEKAKTKASNKFSVEDLIKAMGGDIFISVGMNAGKVDFLVGLSVKDKKAAFDLLGDIKGEEVSQNLFTINNKSKTEKKSSDTEGGNVASSLNLKPLMLFKDDVVLIGNEESLRKINESTFKPSVVSTDWQKALQNKSFNMFIDVQSLMMVGGAAAADKLDGVPMESFSINSGQGVSSFEIKMIEKDKNALFSFIQAIDTITKKQKAKAAALKELELKAAEENDAPSKKTDSTIKD
jgi:Domain of unknown function (DUF4836)